MAAVEARRRGAPHPVQQLAAAAHVSKLVTTAAAAPAVGQRRPISTDSGAAATPAAPAAAQCVRKFARCCYAVFNDDMLATSCTTASPELTVCMPNPLPTPPHAPDGHCPDIAVVRLRLPNEPVDLCLVAAAAAAAAVTWLAASSRVGLGGAASGRLPAGGPRHGPPPTPQPLSLTNPATFTPNWEAHAVLPCPQEARHPHGAPICAADQLPQLEPPPGGTAWAHASAATPRGPATLTHSCPPPTPTTPSHTRTTHPPPPPPGVLQVVGDRVHRDHHCGLVGSPLLCKVLAAGQSRVGRAPGGAGRGAQRGCVQRGCWGVPPT